MGSFRPWFAAGLHYRCPVHARICPPDWWETSSSRRPGWSVVGSAPAIPQEVVATKPAAEVCVKNSRRVTSAQRRFTVCSCNQILISDW